MPHPGVVECLMLVLCACSTEISLKQRLEYISRAILSAKSSSCVSSLGADGEFLHELEEKMEVMTQKQLLMTLYQSELHVIKLKSQVIKSELQMIVKIA